MLVCSFQVCFFFKQKTAYDMRISDWSSDVCSSDLRRGDEPLGAARHVGRRPLAETPVELGLDFRQRPVRNDEDLEVVGTQPALLEADQIVARESRQIGSAACRARVSKYG